MAHQPEALIQQKYDSHTWLVAEEHEAEKAEEVIENGVAGVLYHSAP